MEIKILHAAETIKGGVASVINLLHKNIYLRDSDVLMEYLVPEAQLSELSLSEDSKINTFRCEKRGLFSSFNFAVAFLLCLIKSRPDIVHLHSSFAGFIGRMCILIARPICNPKVIYSPHAFSFIMKKSGVKISVYKLLERVLSRYSDNIICVSKHEYNSAKEAGISEDKLVLVYNGTEIINERDLDEGRKKREGGFEGKIRILYVGRLDYQKGFDTLIEAFKSLDRNYFELTVVGGAVHGHEEEFINGENGINFVGWVKREEIGKYFYNSDLLVIPSRWEGFAMTPLEAMAHSLPIISSDFSSLVECVEDGSNGYVFRVGDSENLASIIKTLSVSTLRKMGENGRHTHSNKFSDVAMSDEVLKIYYGTLRS